MNFTHNKYGNIIITNKQYINDMIDRLEHDDIIRPMDAFRPKSNDTLKNHLTFVSNIILDLTHELEDKQTAINDLQKDSEDEKSKTEDFKDKYEYQLNKNTKLHNKIEQLKDNTISVYEKNEELFNMLKHVLSNGVFTNIDEFEKLRTKLLSIKPPN